MFNRKNPAFTTHKNRLFLMKSCNLVRSYQFVTQGKTLHMWGFETRTIAILIHAVRLDTCPAKH